MRFSWRITKQNCLAKLSALSLIVISCYGIYSAYKHKSASLDFYFSSNELAKWQENGAITTQESYSLALNSISNARSFHPSNAFYIDLHAQIIEWGVVSGMEDKSLLDYSKQQYIKSIQYRPMWPVTWANLAMIKLRKFEYDEQLLFYLQQAKKMGPHTNEVNVLYAKLGLILYSNNHPFYLHIKEKSRDSLLATLYDHNTRKQMIDMIKDTNNIRQVCRWFSNEPEIIIGVYLRCQDLNNLSMM